MSPPAAAAQSQRRIRCDGWGWEASRARKLIGAARTYDGLESVKIFTVLPTVESHVYPLLSLPDPATQAEVWGRVIDVSQQTGERITARLVKQEADRKLAELERNWTAPDY